MSEEASLSIQEERIQKIESCLKEDDKIDKRLINGVCGSFSDNTIEEIRKVVERALIEEDQAVSLEMMGVNGKEEEVGEVLHDRISCKNKVNGLSYLYEEYCNNRYKEYKKSNINDYIKFDINDYSNFSVNEYNKLNKYFSGIKNYEYFDINEYNKFNNRYDNINEHQVISFKKEKNAPWGLCMMSDSASDYKYIKNGGKEVFVYVVDTGIDVNHDDFEGRARWGYNALQKSADNDDNGHGTHCAGIIGGKKYGVAKGAELVAVKVLDQSGKGMISKIIEGIDFVIRDHSDRVAKHYMVNEKTINKYHDLKEAVEKMENESKKKVKTVVNLSVGGMKSAALNFAIDYATTRHGIHFVSAAGNEGKNACNFSPASARSVLTVGACDSNYNVASFSNFGGCVDIYAPGVDIKSAWPENEVKNISGTSMASPHVAGIMAVYLGLSDFTPATLKSRILLDGLARIKTSYMEVNEIPVASLINLYSRLEM